MHTPIRDTSTFTIINTNYTFLIITGFWPEII